MYDHKEPREEKQPLGAPAGRRLLRSIWEETGNRWSRDGSWQGPNCPFFCFKPFGRPVIITTGSPATLAPSHWLPASQFSLQFRDPAEILWGSWVCQWGKNKKTKKKQIPELSRRRDGERAVTFDCSQSTDKIGSQSEDDKVITAKQLKNIWCIGTAKRGKYNKNLRHTRERLV